jgi:enoyl-[acyl-carrier protein] reductase/trans-2-enoyl-CoA reductase (NAD+)
MIIKPKSRGFICTTAHPDGCYKNVEEQINYVKSQGKIDGPKNVLIIGSSTGYGLASRIVSTFAFEAKTIGVFFEKPPKAKSTASAGWYNTAAFEKIASKSGYYAKSINGDAFSNEVKEQVIELIKNDLGKIDLIIYSLAAPKKIDPNTGEKFNSVLKPIGEDFSDKSVDFNTGKVSKISVEPANEDEIKNTIEVMGGKDWSLWIDFLNNSNLLSDNFKTVAYSYIGPKLTFPLYAEGTIGKAKDNLLETVDIIDKKIENLNGKAYVSINKALVTQASSAIPIIPLYISILFKLMKENNTHEGCIEQIYRLFKTKLYTEKTEVDELGRIRIDDLELKDDIQKKVTELWEKSNSENIYDISDLNGYKEDFYKLFGFGFDGVDYEKDTDPTINIPSIK